MLSNVQQIRLYGLIITTAVIVLGIVFNISAERRYDDVRVLNAVRSLSYAAEEYKRDIWTYPSSEPIDARRGIVFSENGVAEGDREYFRERIESHKPIVYTSDGVGYTITFSLRRSWPEQGLESKKCTIRETYQLSCAKPDVE
jgi:hypothetical protein